MLWYKEFSGTLIELGLEACKEEPCIYIDPAYKVFILFYIDDIQVIYHKSDEALA
jgi:hypothetical protein